MSTVAFDTPAQVKHRVQTGVPEAWAEAFVDVVAGAAVLPEASQLATKSDAAALNSEVASLECDFKGEIKGLKGELIWRIFGGVAFTAVFPQLLAHLPE